jgi:hypothetical protein
MRNQIKPDVGKATQFKKGQSGNPKGRPVKVFSQLSREYKERGIERATAQAVAESFEYLLALPLSELFEIAGNPRVENDLPSILRLSAKEMLGKNLLPILKEMLDRAHGRPPQKNDITSGGEAILFGCVSKPLTEAQIDMMLAAANAQSDELAEIPDISRQQKRRDRGGR